MRRALTIIILCLSGVVSLFAETYSVSLSLNSLTVDTPTVLLRGDDAVTMPCTFTADISMGLGTLQTILNDELRAAGIGSVTIYNVRKHPTSASYFFNMAFETIGMSQTRIFHLGTSSGTTTVTLVKDSDGILDCFELTGEWVSVDSDNFTLELSGSQPTVTYLLQQDGNTVRTRTGTGGKINFGTFVGESAHGDYTVLAQYEDWDDQVVGTVRMVRHKDIGGNNYTAVNTYTKVDGSSYYTDVTYYNGLGYPEQEIMLEGASDNMNLVKPVAYDNMMRADAISYIPYPSTEDTGRYIEDVLTAHHYFYHNTDRPFSENTFESGTQGRLLTSQKPGDIYQTFSKKSLMEYGVNDGSENILDLRYNYADSGLPASVSKTGLYGGEKLLYTMSVTEDNDTSYVFTDIFDKPILNRTVSDGINHDTYFIYDMKDSLVCVIQPEGSYQIGNGFSFDDELCQNFCFTYTYDDRGNVIERHIPGCGKEVMAYDLRNRMVLYADAEMLLHGKYRYTVYDSMDRIIQEGYSYLVTSLDIIRNALRNNAPVLPLLTDRMVTRTVTYYTPSDTVAVTSHPQSRAYIQGISYDGCMNMPMTEVVYAEPYFEEGSLQRSAFQKTRRFYYDTKGRLTLLAELDNDGWMSVYSWKNDFTGNVLRHTEEHFKNNVFGSLMINYSYDKRGRMKTMYRNLNGVSFAPVLYDYDDFGRLRVKTVAGRGTEVYGYNLQGWQESSSAYFYGHDVFSQTMNYQIPFMDQSKPRFDGMVSEIRYRHLDKDIQTVSYEYDGLHRLTGSERFINWDTTSCNMWSEKQMEYDRNGNLKHVSRQKGNGSPEDIFFSHLGNQTVDSYVAGTDIAPYEYYADGNLKTDIRRNLQFRYNLLNLPSVVTDSYGQQVKTRYNYLADGTKLAVRDGDGYGYAYRGSFVYRTLPNGGEYLESIAHDEGRIIAVTSSTGTSTQFIDTWHVKDYLGSVRAVLDITKDTTQVSDPAIAILEQNDYLPFGIRMSVDTLAYDQSNRYRFNGKEEQVTGGLGLIDYGARFYDNLYPRWTTPDPLAEKYYGTSPYAFCNNNPVNFVDPDGASWGKAYKAVKKVYKTAKAGGKISVKGILKSEALGIADNVYTLLDSDASLFEKGVATFDLATGFGDELKWAARAVGVSDAIVDGTKTVDGVKFKSFTVKNFRENLKRLTGEAPDASKHAHHIFPKGITDFSKTSINPNDPHYGIWLDKDLHLGEKRAIEYNMAWKKFFIDNPTPTTDQLFDHAKLLMKEIYETDVF